MRQEIDETSEVTQYPLGAILNNSEVRLRYCRAGDKLEANQPAYAHFKGEIPTDEEGCLIITKEFHESLWGDIRSKGDKRAFRGAPLVGVEPRQYFWLLSELSGPGKLVILRRDDGHNKNLHQDVT